MNLKRLLHVGFVALIFFVVQPAFAQNKTIVGKVTDSKDKSALIGVSIIVKGSSAGSNTDAAGNFRINAPASATTLVVSYIGYTTQVVAIPASNTVNVSLVSTTNALNEVVVVGYGTQRRADVTGAVTSLSTKDFNSGSVASANQLFQGRASGINVTSTSGQPGAASSVRIRGGTSINGNNNPLYVVDGVPLDNSSASPSTTSPLNANEAGTDPLSTINPADIESIDVLKDASAAAIYGNRAANGVIIITTKRGRSGKPVVAYDGNYGLSFIAKKLDLLTGDEYRAYAKQNNISSPYIGSANTDWQKAITRVAPTDNQNVSVSGGSDNTNYRVTANYFDQRGIVLNSGLTRYSSRVNLGTKLLNNKLNITLNFAPSYTVNDNITNGYSGVASGGVIYNAIKFNPTQPIYGSDGNYTQPANTANDKNPVQLLNAVNDHTYTTRLLGNTTAEYEIISGLKAKINVGADLTSATRRSYAPKSIPYYNLNYGGLAAISDLDKTNYVTEGTLEYHKKVAEKQDLTILGGYTFQRLLTQTNTTSASHFVSDQTNFNNLYAAGVVNQPTSDYARTSLQAYLARLNYNIADKYLLTANFRIDQSSNFAPSKRTGYFPGGSLAWRISQEDFLKDSKSINNLKLRVGYGQTGNQDVPNYSYISRVDANSTSSGSVTGALQPGYAPVNVVPNPNLTWEVTKQTNIGLDYGLFGDRITGNIDLYNKITSNLLFASTPPNPAAGSIYYINAGKVRNRGIEFLISTKNIVDKAVTWSTDFNISYNQNRVLALSNGLNYLIFGPVQGQGLSGTNSQMAIVGQPLGAFFGPTYAGVNADGTEKLVYPTGYKADGTPNIIGNAQPKILAGINNTFHYKQYDLSFFFRGQFGNKIFNNTAAEFRRASNIGQNINLISGATTDGLSTNSTVAYSSRFIENGSFVKLQNVNLGYNVGIKANKYINSLRLFLTGQNLLTFTKYTGYDPEVQANTGTGTGGTPSIGIDYAGYPSARTVTLGVSARFQ